MKLICKSSRSCKLDSATTTRRNHHSWVALTRMEVHREQTGSPPGTDRKSSGHRQEVHRAQTGSLWGTDRKSTGHRQEVLRAQTGSQQRTDRKSSGHRQEGHMAQAGRSNSLLPPSTCSPPLAHLPPSLTEPRVVFMIPAPGSQSRLNTGVDDPMENQNDSGGAGSS